MKVKARYLNGIIKPLKPISLEEEREIIVIIRMILFYQPNTDLNNQQVHNPEKAKEELNNFLSFVKIPPINEKICEYYGKGYARLCQINQFIGGFDLLIATTCLIYNLTLLTNNTGHFKKISGPKIETLTDESHYG